MFLKTLCLFIAYDLLSVYSEDDGFDGELQTLAHVEVVHC